MTKIDCHHSVRRLLVATALPLGLLTAGAMAADAGVVSVTGANGTYPGGAGGDATADTTTPRDPSNDATAQGGAGGLGPPGRHFGGCFLICSPIAGDYGIIVPPGPGGAGGAASATATTSIGSGPASAAATSTGGAGGRGGLGNGFTGGRGGVGGAANSTATASSATGAASASATSKGGSGGAGGTPGGATGAGGAAAASSTARSNGGGQVHAMSYAVGGAGGTGGGASATAVARNTGGRVVTTASSPGGSAAKALANATVGAGSASPVAFYAGRTVSNAVFTTGGSATIGVGAMSAAYGGSGAAIEYEATAIFDLTASEPLYLNLLSDNVSGTGFDSLTLKVNAGGTGHTYRFSTLSGANRSSPRTRSTSAPSPQASPSSWNICSTTTPAHRLRPATASASPMTWRPRLSPRRAPPPPLSAGRPPSLPSRRPGR